MADKLQGNHIKIDTPTVKKNIGKRVKYLVKGDSGIYPRTGVITEIFRKQIDFGGSEWIFLNQITELVVLD
jgi:hypothetical protein